MSSSRTSVHTSTENAVRFVNNQLIEGFIKITTAAGVSNKWLVDQRENLTDAITHWLSEQTLLELRYEILDSNGNKLKRYIFDISYEGDKGYIDFDATDICNVVPDYSHRNGAYAWVIPITSKEASQLPGWEREDVTDDGGRRLSSFGAGHIDIGVEESRRY